MYRKSVLVMFVFSSIAASQVGHAQEPQPSRVVKQLAEKGFKKCGPDLDKLVKWAHEDDSGYALLSTWSVNAPDQRTAMTITNKSSAAGGAVTTFTATPDASGKCSVTSTQVWTFSQSCTVLRENSFKNWKFVSDLGGSSMYEEKENNLLTVLLTSIHGGGCMVLKTAVIYY